MLYEDPKADPQSDRRFHVEIHFSPGAMAVREQRAASATAQSVPHQGNRNDDSGQAPNAGAGGCVHGAQVVHPCDESAEDDTCLEGERTVILSEEPRTERTATADSSARSSESVKNSASPVDKKGLDYDESDDVTYEYGSNECPRYSIGCGDFTDSQPTSRSDSANTSSGLSVEESSAERPYSKSDTQLLSAMASQEVRTLAFEDEIRRLSDSDVRIDDSPTRSQPISIPASAAKEAQNDQGRAGSLPDDCKELSNEDSPTLEANHGRRKSHSVSEIDAPPHDEFLDTAEVSKKVQDDEGERN